MLSGMPTQLWAIMVMVEFIRKCILKFVERKIAWISRRCNRMAQWAASFGISGFTSISVVPEHIQLCDVFWFLVHLNKMRYYSAKKKKQFLTPSGSYLLR